MFDNLRNIMNFDEVLFEKRNREYGAYQLRKKYNSVMTASVIIAILIFSASVLIPFLARPKNEKILAGGYGNRSVTIQNFEPPDQIYVPPVTPPPPPARTEQITKYIPPEVVDTLAPLEPTLPTPEEITELEDLTTDFEGSGSGNNPYGVEGGVDSDQPFFFVEQMPTFRGGDINKFRLWVQQHTFYPQEAINKKIRGKVHLTFVVEKDGSISNVTVIESLDPMIDSEAVKAIESSPKWNPGIQRGQPVRVRYSIVLNFTF